MISRVKIANYKSVEQADFEARRVNVFIGEPNSGKSNILEAVAFPGDGLLDKLRDLFRIEQMADVFLDQEIGQPLTVALEGIGVAWELKFKNGVFRLLGVAGSNLGEAHFGADGNLHGGGVLANSIRFYRYRSLKKGEWDGSHFGYLLPPFGANLPNLLYTNKALRDSASAFFRDKGFRLELRPHENEVLMSKIVDDVITSFPFVAISETMRRIVFYKAALETSRDAVLVLDEPEANTFPFYTKYLAERIALDGSNQFFLSTHNSYVLLSLIEKTPPADLAVFATRMRNYRTEVRQLTPEDLQSVSELGMAAFFNLDQFFAE